MVHVYNEYYLREHFIALEWYYGLFKSYMKRLNCYCMAVYYIADLFVIKCLLHIQQFVIHVASINLVSREILISNLFLFLSKNLERNSVIKIWMQKMCQWRCCNICILFSMHLSCILSRWYKLNEKYIKWLYTNF